MFKSIVYEDLPEIQKLQPIDWPDILPYIRFYIESPFCFPVKVLKDNRIVGIGASIVHSNTAWLAHIIVSPEYRNHGVGNSIVEELLSGLSGKKCKSILLIATKLGEPVYKKKGFRIVTDYLFFKRDAPTKFHTFSNEIIPFGEKYTQQIFALDKKITGEDRRILFINHIADSLLFVKGNKVLGFYLPGLGEGPIIADEIGAGIELMRFKYAEIDKAVLPAENIQGTEFLIENGFKDVSKGYRMILGEDIHWHPEKIFSRIGGNFG